MTEVMLKGWKKSKKNKKNLACCSKVMYTDNKSGTNPFWHPDKKKPSPFSGEGVEGITLN